MRDANSYKRSGAKIVAVAALILVFMCMALASGFNADWGRVSVKDVYYPNSEGGILHVQLFVPETASSASPVPAILNMHGGSDYLQTVSNYSIELARRGYVVLSVDAYGSGSSDFVSGGAATSAGSSGENTALKMDGGASLGIEQLLGYKFVDPDNIGLIGHSMGGTYIANAALEYAENVRAIMPWGSGSFVDMMKSHDSSEFTFNVGYINAKNDEMVVFATGEETSALLDNDQLKAFVGAEDTIVTGQVYGNFDEGTARVIYTPNTTHIGNIINTGSIGSLVSFFEQAMPTGSNLDSGNQVWMYKELFCSLAIIALLIFSASLGCVLLDSHVFAVLKVSPSAPAACAGRGVKLAGILICIAIPAITLHRVGLWLASKSPSAFMPMNWANSLAWLALINALILLIFFVIWHFVYARKRGGRLAAYGFGDAQGKISVKNILLALWYAVCLIFCVFVVVNLGYAMFKIDFRFWQFGIMPISLKRFSKILGYLLILTVAFGIMDTVSVVFASIGNEGSFGKAVKQYVLSWLIGAGGFAIIMIIYYVGLRTTHRPPFFLPYPPFASGHPNSLVFSMKTTVLVPTFTIISVLNTALYRKSKNIYVGWFSSALFAALILIGTNAYAI